LSQKNSLRPLQTLRVPLCAFLKLRIQIVDFKKTKFQKNFIDKSKKGIVVKTVGF